MSTTAHAGGFGARAARQRRPYRTAARESAAVRRAVRQDGPFVPSESWVSGKEPFLRHCFFPWSDFNVGSYFFCWFTRIGLATSGDTQRRQKWWRLRTGERESREVSAENLQKPAGCVGLTQMGIRQGSHQCERAGIVQSHRPPASLGARVTVGS